MPYVAESDKKARDHFNVSTLLFYDLSSVVVFYLATCCMVRCILHCFW